MNSRFGPGIRESLQHRDSSRPQRPQGPQPIPQLAQSTPRSHHAQYTEGIGPAIADHHHPADDANKTRGLTDTKAQSAATSDAVLPPAQNVSRHVQKGRPHVFFSNGGTTMTESLPSSPQGQHADTAIDLPLPPRSGHWLFADLATQSRTAPQGIGYSMAATGKPAGAEPQHPEPLFPGGRNADMSFWTGNNPEDALSETLVKAGVSNKAQIMNETNTARPSLWSNLKSRAGLSNLSSLFLALLEKRQSCGRITLSSSFKPPPRLTLRDSTREAWLHDLANPAVGLRRLSRTIPHGITGTVLLDHCLNKNIPLPRAIWLAKCVGINEMRSHKRKGQAGTLTWVRGWTSSVEQFLEIAISTVGQQGWKPRVTYALQLATSLYKEQLLDDEHFLDWVLKNLAACPTERLFLWLMIVSIYRQDLTSSRRRGKRLAELLLNHITKFYAASETSHEPTLIWYLEQLLLKILVTSPSCLLLPDGWPSHLPVLQRLALKYPDSKALSTVQDLTRRARRLGLHSLNDHSAHVPAREIISLLDAVDYASDVNVDVLANQCWDCLSDARDLVSITLQWASSCHRIGMHRIYLVARLLCKWWRSGIDTDDAILTFFQSANSSMVIEPCNIYRIVAELVRSKTFSVGRYLQWLISTGSFNQNCGFTSSSFCPMRLMVEIPVSGLPEHVRNLRSTLLRGTPHSTESEEDHLDQAEYTIRSRLCGLFGTGVWSDIQPDIDLTEFTPTVQLEIALFLRHHVASNVRTSEPGHTNNTLVNGDCPVSTITLRDFHLVRSYLEEFGQLSILADVMGIMVTSLDFDVLAAAADTLHYHHLAFKAIGAFKALFESIILRYSMLRTFRTPERDVLLGLTRLCHATQVDARVAQLLASDLGRLEQRNSISACSPVSDTTAEAIQNTAAESDEDIDRILCNSSTLDQAAMTEMLNKIMTNLSEQITKRSLQPSQHASWLHRLRVLNEVAFDIAIMEWLKNQFLQYRQMPSIPAVAALVTSGCLSFMQLLRVARDCFDEQQRHDPERAHRIPFAFFHLIVPTDRLTPFCHFHEAYRFRLEQRSFCLALHAEVLQFLSETIRAVQASPGPDGEAHLESLLLNSEVRNILKQYILSDVQAVSQAFGISSFKSGDVAISSPLKVLLDTLLDPCDCLHLAKKSIMQQIELIPEAVDELSLRFCQLKIQCLFFMATGSTDCSRDTLSSAFLTAIISAAQKNDSACLDLVGGLEPDLAFKIREFAEREVLGATSFLANPLTTVLGNIPKEEEARIERYLAIIRTTSSKLIRDEQSQAIGPLANRLKGLAELMDRHSDHGTKVMSSAEPPNCCVAIAQWLNVLLRLVVAQRVMLLHKVSSQHQAALMWSLRRVFTHPALNLLPSMSEYTFDAALFISDALPDDVRLQLSKLNIAKTPSDSRCVFLFECCATKDGWLALVRSTLASGEPGSMPGTFSPQPQSSIPQTQLQFENALHVRSANPGMLQRPQHHQQSQMQTQSHPQTTSRGYFQYPQHPQQSKTVPQISPPSTAPVHASQHGQLQQMHRIQQMQGLTAQRNLPPSPANTQRHLNATTHAGLHAGKSAPLQSKQESGDTGMTPFLLSPWEILPEASGNSNLNETAISLGLFAARKL
ncbi:uncharacterized protein EI97DRAFT_464783 [Westerdykella ornata]|uniref:Mediator of RNA polymerase II transcription subunit 12 n=1 Tax=Westerdykella ornata TaxID=318751 RepID=A0A6A6JUQ4_WESOR|nr:uncharacterized protein EI97DRAFT_464783 [Westerdykella ornata]KAF2279548.1 hypothetical protein EI97DRAFT_464783 [Westerdykella ornata]